MRSETVNKRLGLEKRGIAGTSRRVLELPMPDHTRGAGYRVGLERRFGQPQTLAHLAGVSCLAREDPDQPRPTSGAPLQYGKTVPLKHGDMVSCLG